MKRFIAFLLLLSFLCSILFVGSSVAATQSENQEPERLGEIVGLREKNSETYCMSDGTYECIVFSDNKYYEGIDGSLELIDNTIVPTEIACCETEYEFTNKSNSSHFFFSETEPMVLVSTNEYSLEFNAITDCTTKGLVGGLKDVESIAEYSLSGDNFIAYSGIYDNTDIVYEVKNGILKEYIVLKSASSPNEFKFSFNTEGYLVSYSDKGTVEFYDKAGKLAFELGSLFAVDSANKYTEEVTYSLGVTVDNKTEITVSLSEDYLSDPARVYPLLIDPSIMITGENNTKDSYVSSRYPTANYYLNNYIKTGRDADYYIRRTYIKFDLPAYLYGKNITSAYINIKKYTGSTPSINAYRVTGSWTSSTINWNNKPSFSTVNASSSGVASTNNWYKLYVTNIVSSWTNGAYTNYGFMIKDLTETGTSQWTAFYSSDAPSPNKPELRITYLPQYTFYMDSYVDQGYRVRFSNGISKVEDYQSVIESILEDLFDVAVICSTNSYSSLADDCKISTYGSVTFNHLDDSCFHSPNHLTSTALRNRLTSVIGSGTQTLTRYIWTGHDLNHEYSASSLSDHIVVMTPWFMGDGITDYTIRWVSLYDLLHNTSKQLGAHDHYCYGTHGNNTCSNPYCYLCYYGITPPECIMTISIDIEAASNDDLYCSNCNTIINSHLADHH